MWEENIKFSQDLNGIEAAKISYSGSVFSSLSLSEPFHFLMYLKRKSSETDIKAVLIMFLGYLNPKGGNLGEQALDHKFLEWGITFYHFTSPRQLVQYSSIIYWQTERLMLFKTTFISILLCWKTVQIIKSVKSDVSLNAL